MRGYRVFWAVVLCIYASLQADTLNVGLYQPNVTGYVSKKDFLIGMNVFIKEFAHDEHIDYTITYYDDSAKLASDFKSGKINFIASDALSVVENIPINLLEKGIMGFRINKNDAQTLVLLSLVDDDRSLAQKLSGTIATDENPVFGLYIKTLRAEHIPSRPAELLTTKNPQQSILKLFFHQSDLAVVDRASYLMAVELNPQLKSRLSVIKSVPLAVGSVSYMRKGTNPQLVSQVLRAGKTLNDTARGRQLLQLFKATRMDESNPVDLEGVYRLNEQYRKLSNGKKGA